MIPLTEPDPALSALQQAWASRWKIWRSRTNPHLDIRDGDYYASRLDESAGIRPTVFGKTPADLDRVLHEEAKLVEQGAQPLTISHFGPS